MRRSLLPGAVLGWLLTYLNQYANSVSAGQSIAPAQLFFSTLLFAALAPTILRVEVRRGTTHQ